MNALNTENPLPQLEALTNIAKLLSIVEVFPTPQERFGIIIIRLSHLFVFDPHFISNRRGVAEIIIKIFEVLVQTSVIPRVIHILNHSSLQQPQLLVCLQHFLR